MLHARAIASAGLGPEQREGRAWRNALEAFRLHGGHPDGHPKFDEFGADHLVAHRPNGV